MSQTQVVGVGTGDTSALDPETWRYDAVTLRGVRDQNSARLQAARETWYHAQVRSLEERAVLPLEAVKAYANELAITVRGGLTRAAERGESEFILDIFTPIETQGWRFATYHENGEASHRVFDLSMNVEEHQLRIRAASLLVEVLEQANMRCQVDRAPSADTPDCFLEALRIRVSL